RMALENLSVAFPEQSGSERLAIPLAHWEYLGRVIVETLQIDRLLADPSCIDLPDRHLLAHYGNKLRPAIGDSPPPGKLGACYLAPRGRRCQSGRALPRHHQPPRRCLPPRPSGRRSIRPG